MNKTDRGCASEDLTEEDLDEVEDGDNDYTSAAAEGGGSIAMNELREAMSKRMWEDYQAILISEAELNKLKAVNSVHISSSLMYFRICPSSGMFS
ncbi:hypothetical protein D6C99_10099 [Aureobasidium pullulans]|nr:hypothetical protein D6D29_10215 [Aureobasidium pullulans]THY36735.1 hypothetical protein D6C99_10099 [Aureobasidium pullulans]